MANYNVTLAGAFAWADGELIFNQGNNNWSYKLTANQNSYSASGVAVTNNNLTGFSVNLPPQYTLTCSGSAVTVSQPIGGNNLPGDEFTGLQQGGGNSPNYLVSFTDNRWADGTLNVNTGSYNPGDNATGANVTASGILVSGSTLTAVTLAICDPDAQPYSFAFSGGPTNGQVNISSPSGEITDTTEADTWEASAVPVPDPELVQHQKQNHPKQKGYAA